MKTPNSQVLPYSDNVLCVPTARELDPTLLEYHNKHWEHYNTKWRPRFDIRIPCHLPTRDLQFCFARSRFVQIFPLRFRDLIFFPFVVAYTVISSLVPARCLLLRNHVLKFEVYKARLYDSLLRFVLSLKIWLCCKFSQIRGFSHFHLPLRLSGLGIY